MSQHDATFSDAQVEELHGDIRKIWSELICLMVHLYIIQAM